MVYNVAVNKNTYMNPNASTINPPMLAATDQNIPHANVSKLFHLARELEGTISMINDRLMGPEAFIKAFLLI